MAEVGTPEAPPVPGIESRSGSHGPAREATNASRAVRHIVEMAVFEPTATPG